MKKYILYLFLNCLAILGFSQTGPGGVGTSANNVLWLKADSETFSDAGITKTIAAGTTVQQWNDQSGNAKHATQLTLGNRPTMAPTSALSFNSMPTLSFNGSSGGGISSTSLTTGGSGLATVYAVFNYLTLPGNNSGIIQGSPNTKAYSATADDKSIGMWVRSTDGKIWGRGIQTDNNRINLTANTGITLATNTVYIATNQYDGSNINQYVNGTLSGTVSYNGTLNSWIDLAVGSQGTETWNGNIAEVIIYKTSLNIAQRIVVNNYLSSKYDIALSTNDKYTGDQTANGDYDFNVAGLGKESDGSSANFSSSATLGMGVTATDGLDNGDYVFIGKKNTANSVNTTDITGITGPNPARWNRDWYVDVTDASTTLTTSVVFNIAAAGMGTVTAGAVTNYKLLRRAATTGGWTEVATASSASGSDITFTSIILADGYYTLGSNNTSVSPLPIELVNFGAIKNGDKVDINWTTATETNNDYFLIEKSKDAIHFEPFQKVVGAGDSRQLRYYTEVDFSPFDGTSYYRLKQVDNDGTFSYSNIVAVNYTFDETNISAFPNPSNGNFNLNIKGLENKEILVVIRDMSGREFYSKVIITQQNNELVAVDLEHTVPSGIYIIVATSANKLYSQKITIK